MGGQVISGSPQPVIVTVQGTLDATVIPNGLGTGQSIVNFADQFTYTANTASNRRTNTATKKLYVQTITVGNAGASFGIQIKDNTTTIWRSNAIAAGCTTITFPTPLVFATNFTVEITANQAAAVSATGWEE